MPDQTQMPRNDSSIGTAPGATTSHTCVSCGSPHARRWSTPDGPAQLCPACATLHGLGCP